MGEAETRQGIGTWPWVAMSGGALALAARIVVMLRHPGGDGNPSANFHPWILWGGLPALALSIIAFLAARRAKQPQGALMAGFVAFFYLLMVFISL
ncbi:MAG TPA: hypothetical protein VFF76_08730 [Holophagaceae bacterium]|jgi:hypothetical protein|nr:hypothetical protein [Holophagaceae bacterium]